MDRSRSVGICIPNFRKAFNSTKHRLLEQEVKVFRADAKVKDGYNSV